jgi:hypothetical protein
MTVEGGPGIDFAMLTREAVAMLSLGIDPLMRDLAASTRLMLAIRCDVTLGPRPGPPSHAIRSCCFPGN